MSLELILAITIFQLPQTFTKFAIFSLMMNDRCVGSHDYQNQF